MKRFDIITEADARVMDHGATVAPRSIVRASLSVMMSKVFIYSCRTAMCGRFRYFSAKSSP